MQTYWINAQAVFLQKHDFAAYVHQIYQHYQNWCFWQLKKYSNNSHTHIKEEFSDKSTRSHFYGGGKALLFSSDELLAYTLTDLLEQQYQFLRCVKKIKSRTLFLMMVIYRAVCLLTYLLWNWHWKLQKYLLVCMTCICLQKFY